MELGKLEKVELRTVWAREDSHFTTWLAKEENLTFLAEELNIGLELIAQEKNVGPFQADLLCRDTATEKYVVIENQFGKTDHSHLGQVLTYASGLNALTIIWIAEKFVEEHRATLDWLNSVTDETVQFFGVEIELYKIGNSSPAPRFNIISKPNNWSKTIRRTAQSATQLTETKILQQEYWQALKEYVEKQKVSFKMQKALPQHWTNIAVGKTDYKICAIANSRDKWIGIQLVVYGKDALENFRALRQKYEENSKLELSDELEWAEKDGGKEHHVNYIIPEKNPMDRNEWEGQHRILTDWIDKFHKYFSDKVKSK
ncbi:MAG: DUF4268 domain-containing protein [Saprospiraceae bacterium]